jgi:1,4-dihydroxy-2-naphthoate polyprenyltransferase
MDRLPSVAKPKQQRIDPKKVTAAAATRPVPPTAKKKSGRPGGAPPSVPKPKKATLGDWISAARPLTLALAIAPVALGTAAAYVLPHPDAGPWWHWLRAGLALAVAVALQIGVNYANDYSDGIRGTDKQRVGPKRLVASGAAKPRTVLIVALVFFALAAAAGSVIVVRTGIWWLFAVGAVCILAAYFYTGGKKPYGYYGLGELFVFAFFGIVATAGTQFVLANTVTIEGWLAGTCAGLFACAALMINNIRDRENDKLVGKRTLAVLIGNLPARIVYAVFMVVPFGILAFFVLFYENAYLVYFALLAALPSVLIGITGQGKDLVVGLRLTLLTAVAFAIGLGWAIAF